ncbi:MAG TPA: phosphodiester glycosidase family protein [Vitreimonas sp.]|jgi:prepilin-type processing-associated H-X9-DG protein|nr:phosphodiester glycosidase family protein [Vitreimonas sp.]
MRQNPLRLAILTAAAIVVMAATTLLWGQQQQDIACVEQHFEGARFLVCPLDTRHHELRLADVGRDGAPLRNFRALEAFLGADAARVRFAMNAGMFDARGEPIGLYVENGSQQHRLNLANGPGNFHLKPNGVFWQEADGAVHVATTEAFAAREATPKYATQSGPMLVIDGALHPRFAPDGDSHYIRNGVGVRDAHTAYFVISRDEVSFGRFARFFRDGLNCRNALFLDGHVSSLWAPQLNRQDRGPALGPMVVVLNRAQGS